MVRPPKTYSNEEAEALGKDLLAWIQSQEGKDTFIWVNWYWNKHNMFRDDWRALCQREEFLPYYKMARKIMMSNMVRNKEVHHSYGHRYLSLYDDEVLEHEEGIKDRDVQRNAEGQVIMTNEGWTKLQGLLGNLSARKATSENKPTEENHS